MNVLNGKALVMHLLMTHGYERFSYMDYLHACMLVDRALSGCLVNFILAEVLIFHNNGTWALEEKLYTLDKENAERYLTNVK